MTWTVSRPQHRERTQEPCGLSSEEGSAGSEEAEGAKGVAQGEVPTGTLAEPSQCPVCLSNHVRQGGFLSPGWHCQHLGWATLRGGALLHIVAPLAPSLALPPAATSTLAGTTPNVSWGQTVTSPTEKQGIQGDTPQSSHRTEDSGPASQKCRGESSRGTGHTVRRALAPK